LLDDGARCRYAAGMTMTNVEIGGAPGKKTGHESRDRLSHRI
jgi:hypothetical protein